jgi:hypothetical protein
MEGVSGSARDWKDFVRDLRALHREGWSGLVEVRGNQVRTFLYFEQGTPVFAEEGTLGDTLGRILLDRGMLTWEQYGRVIERMTSGLFDSEQMRFGEVAIELGFVTVEQVYEALSAQVRRKLVGCLQWPEVQWQLHARPEMLKEVAHFPCELEPALLEGIRQFVDVERAEEVLAPVRHAYPRRTEPPSVTGQRLGLVAPEVRLLRSVDGTRTMEQVLADSPLDSLVSMQLAAAWVLLEVVDLSREQPAEAAVEAQDGGVAELQRPARAKRDLARRRAAELAVRVRRAQHHGGEQGGSRPRTSSAPPADAHRARMQAEQAFQKGRQFMEYGAWPAAAREFRRAHKRQPEAEYELYALWAEYQSKTDGHERQALREELETHSMAALKRDRRFGFGHYVRGQLALLRGEEETAEKAFRNAVRLDPDNVDAQRHFRLLQRRRAGKKG